MVGAIVARRPASSDVRERLGRFAWRPSAMAALEAKEFFLANTPDWSGDLSSVSRYVVV